MDGDKSGESGVFLFSRRVPDFCDGRRSFPMNESSNLYRRGRRRWISLITNPLNCWAPVPLSRKFQFLAHFPFPAKFIGRIWVWLVAFIQYIWDGQQKVKSPIVWNFPDLWKPGLRYAGQQWENVEKFPNSAIQPVGSFFWQAPNLQCGLIFKSVLYARHFEYSCKRCSSCSTENYR